MFFKNWILLYEMYIPHVENYMTNNKKCTDHDEICFNNEKCVL